MSDADDQMGGQGGRTGLRPEQQSDEAPDSRKGNVGGKRRLAESPGRDTAAHAAESDRPESYGPESDGSESDRVDEASADSFPASDPPGHR